MPSIVYALIILFVTNCLIEPTASALPAYLQNLELDDITSIWDKFPAIIGQIKQAVNRFRCPKGWRRLGGSCYYLSNITSIPSEANQTCNQLHSNQSNLMQIRHTVELFYAAHVLTKNNLSALMIEIDPDLLKGKTMTALLMDDAGRWRRMKDKFREIRIRYYKLKEKILDELNTAGLRISRRSKKIKQSVKNRKEKFVVDHIDTETYDYDNDYYQENNLTISDSNTTDEYEYDDLDSEDQNDDFEHIDDIQGICDQIDWNVLNNNVTVYMLTTFLVEEKIVCSLSNVESDLEYEHVCEYVLDFCFANIVCGTHGRCVNTLSGFKCSCSFLYGGLLCERISRQGKQIILGIILVLVLYGLSLKPIRWLSVMMIKGCIGCCKQLRKKKSNAKEQTREDKQELVSKRKIEEDEDEDEDEDDEDIPQVQDQRRQTIVQEIMEFFLPRNYQPPNNPNKRDLTRVSWVGGLTVINLTLLLSITTITHFTSFKYDIDNETRLDALLNETTQLVAKCGKISNYRTESLIFFPVSLALLIIFSWSIKREKRCKHLFDGRPGLIAPIEPFRTANRFTTATVFGILAFEVLKIFEELLFSTVDPLNRGILIELLERIAMVLVIGLRYYPVLASLQLRNIMVRFFVCLYVIGDIIYTIVREGACMGFLPLSQYYSIFEEATLRLEIGTWFIVYGLIKNTPHFILLSYICAELCVRFVYDSIYVPCKKNLSIWSAPVAQPDEAAFSKYYVTKLFRKSHRSHRTIVPPTKVDENKLVDFEYENELQRKAGHSRVKKFFNSIYEWNDDFRYTTMATCTYTVALVFLYYLACTLVFLYISRTTGHISVVRYYIESTFSIELHGFFSLRSTIILSAVITVALYAFQLFLGMQNYKKHKLQIMKGIYEDVPSAANFNPSSIAAKSVHYSGFLVGYMAWGFIICFHLIFFILSAIRIITLQIRYFEILLAVTVPILVVYLLKMVGTSSAGKFLFIQDMEEKLNLKNRKVYAIFVYFNFFADCFLGIASCIIRLIKASVLNVVYMARLDCSFLGRPLEKFDLGFAAYVSYLHMEVTHTNPIMLAFCYSLYDDVVKRRKKHCYDDECCIAPGELDDDETPVEPVSSKTSNHSINGSVEKTAKVTPVTKKENVVDTIDDDDEGLSIAEVKPKAKSRSPPIISEKVSQKTKQKKLSIDDQLAEIEEDDGPPTPIVSTIARLIPVEQPHLPPPSAPVPEAPTRRDLPPIEKDDDEDDDGGVPPPSISTISKIIPHQAPRLLPMQHSSPPPVPRRQDSVSNKDEDEDDDGGIKPHKTTEKKPKAGKEKTKKVKKHEDDDDDDDDDGGPEPPSISTISKAVSQQAPRLLPVQRSPPPPAPPQAQRLPPPVMFQQVQRLTSPVMFQQAPRPMLLQRSIAPPAPPRQDIAPADDDEDDGGINPKVIAKRKEELEKKKKKKEEMKKKKPVDDDDEDIDDDGGLVKPKQTDKKKKNDDKNKSKAPLIFDDEDDDGGVTKEKRLAAEKKKKELEAKKKKQEEIKTKAKKDQDDEDDDGGVSKEKWLAAEKKKKQELEAKKKKQEEMKVKAKPDEDEDDDGAVKRQDPPPKKTSSKKVSKPEVLKEEDEDDDGGRILKTYDTVKMIMPSKQPILSHQKQKSPSPEALDDGTMYTSRPQQEPLLKSYSTIGRMVPNISTDYRKKKEDVHYDTIPTDEERSARSRTTYSPPPYDKAANSQDLNLLRTISYREATDHTSPIIERRPTAASIRSHSKSNEDSSHYSEITSNTASSSGVVNRSYSNTGSIRSASNHSIKQPSRQSSEHTLKKEEQTEESTVESEKEEEEKPKEKPLKLKPIKDISTAYSTISHIVKPTDAEEIKKVIQQKRARFRWFLAYTILNNYHLFDLRKQVQSRLARLRIERSNLIDDQQHAAAAAAAIPASPGIRSRNLKVGVTSPAAATPTLHRLLSVPVPVVDDYPQSPAERYVAIRSSMLYDVSAQQADTPRSTLVSQVQPKSNITPGSFGFQTNPTVIVHPPSNSTTLSKGKRPSYQRQETEASDPSMLTQLAGTPVFQGIPDSTHSTTGYPLATNSSNTNRSTLRIQMSHAQHMQAWHQNQLKKLQKKRPHCYHYGTPLRQPLEEKVATAAILTPETIAPEDKPERLPSSSPFQFTRQVKTINEKSKNTRPKSANGAASNTDETKQEKALKKKSLRTSSSAVHRKNSEDNFSNVTEV